MLVPQTLTALRVQVNTGDMNSTRADVSGADVMAPSARGRHSGGSRLRMYRNPLRLAVSASLGRSLWYLTAYLVTGAVLATVALIVATGAVIFALTLAGLPLLILGAAALRGCADVERRRLLQVHNDPVRGGYRAISRPGLIDRAAGRWRDPATWRDLAYLLGLWAPLTALDLTVLTVWVASLAEITVPIWYRIPWLSYHGSRIHGVQLFGYFPNGPYGHGAVGVFIGSLPSALTVAGVSLAVFLLSNYAVVAAARAHALVARSLLGLWPDPLAPARQVLAGQPH